MYTGHCFAFLPCSIFTFYTLNNDKNDMETYGRTFEKVDHSGDFPTKNSLLNFNDYFAFKYSIIYSINILFFNLTQSIRNSTKPVRSKDLISQSKK